MLYNVGSIVYYLIDVTQSQDLFSMGSYTYGIVIGRDMPRRNSYYYVIVRTDQVVKL